MSEIDDLVSVAVAAEEAGVGRNTMLRAAKKGTIKAQRIGRSWFIYKSDIERWKLENYRPDMAYRYPVQNEDDSDPPEDE